MIRTTSGFKMRLETLGSQGVVISIDDWPNSNRFFRSVELLATLPSPTDIPMAHPVVELNVAGKQGINVEDAADLRHALEIGIQLMPALQACAASIHAAISFAHPKEYDALADDALRRVCGIALINVV